MPGQSVTLRTARVSDADFIAWGLAEGAGCPVGFCQGWPYGTPAGTRELARAAGFRVLRLASVALFGWPLLAALDRHEAGEWYLQAVAVQEQARGCLHLAGRPADRRG
jgi:hypothetical protein